MRALSWNCRGLGHPRSVRELAEAARLHRLDRIGLQETKIEVGRLEGIQRKLGFKYGFHVPTTGLSGGLALWWREEVNVQILSFSKYHIDARIDGERIERVTLFYGEPVTGRRGLTWSLLKRLNELYEYPWLIMGDFNEVCFSWEVRGGRVRGEWQMRAFRETLIDCGLYDLGYTGNPFTFSNRRAGVMETRARLDRMIANGAWRSIYPNAKVTHISSTSSDHLMVLVDSEVRGRCYQMDQFRFEPMWVRNRNAREVVENAWGKGGRSGSLMTRLQRCKGALRKWNKEVFGSVTQHIKSVKEELEWVRLQERNEENMAKETDIVANLDEWRLKEEIYWKQRSRVEWLREGDRNTSYFHAKASQRKKRNTIVKLLDSRGEWISDEKEKGYLIRDYFTDIFSSSRSQDSREEDRDFNWIQSKVTTEIADRLMAPVTEAEIRAAVFQMPPTKASGPDGFQAIFYQKYWDIVKGSVIAEVMKVFREGRMKDGMNDTLIVLVPKKKKPKTVEEFRPISLCNVAAKIVMKVLPNRLKDILPEIVSEVQSAFVPGRLISDNILLAHEVLHYIKSRKNQKVGFFSVKTDMSKAYDRVEWRFLELMLIKLGFPIPWTRLVLECIKSVRYKVKMNDMLIEIPPPERGLRQGDPMSPYLFLLCAEWLSLKLAREVQLQRLKGVRVCRGAPVIFSLMTAYSS
ncbi:unnamed protein product [Rhodiola kirilowii]